MKVVKQILQPCKGQRAPKLTNIAFWGTMVLLSTFFHLGAVAKENLVLTVYDYPPHIINASTKPSGKLVNQVISIMKEADISTEWLHITMNKEGKMLDEGTRPFCTMGRLHSKERAEKWTFLPFVLMSLQPDIVIARKEKAALISGLTDSETLLKTSTLRGIFVEGGFYGDELNKTLSQELPWHSMAGQTDEHVLSLLESNRADYSILPTNIWKGMGAETRFPNLIRASTKTLHSTGPQPEVFMTCSKAVAPERISQISAAMRTLGYHKSDIYDSRAIAN